MPIMKNHWENTHGVQLFSKQDDLIHANAGRLAQMHLPVSGRRGQVGSQAMKQGQITLAYSAEGLEAVTKR
jgi:hypothetical protein